MTPNQITALRVAMAFAAVALFGRSRWANLAALALTVGAIALDAVDGYLARRKKLATPFGAQLDILGDRVIENLFFTYFAVCGQVSLWVPVLFFARGMLTDFIRSLAARSGRVGFGGNSMLESWWGRALVASRASRAVYGALKCACFCYLGLQLTLATASNGSTAGRLEISRDSMDGLLLGSQILVALTVAFCLLRGLPVVWEGRRYLAAFAEGSRATLAKAKATHNPAGTRAFGIPNGVAGR
ncbi:MAG: CDP-alcohol phosphatidyltransferase family protein [Candidatus Acidiferrales bacterium]